MSELHTSITKAFEYLSTQSVEIPPDLMITARLKGISLKAGTPEGGMTEIKARYNKEIVQALTTYFEGGSTATPKNQFRGAMVEGFNSAFDTGWNDGGAKLPVDDAALAWLKARLNQEVGFIDMLFQEAKELRKDSEFDYFSWITARADGYTNTLKEIYNAARMRATKDQMVTFAGDDGARSCDTCQKLQGKRHKLSWFIARNYIPPFGSGLDCAKGGHCKHGLMDDKGNWVTI